MSPDNASSAPRIDAPAGPKVSLVTGGAGFIGSHLVELLLDRGDRVTVIDDLSTGGRRNLPASHEGLRFIEARLDSALASFGGGERFDEIYHLAASVGVDRVLADPIASIETNVEQTSALLRFAEAHGTTDAGAATLIASSSEVYGKSDKVPFSEEDDVVYGPTTMTRWSYAMGKAIDEHLALAYHGQQRTPTSVVRFFNTVGPRQIGRYGMVLPRFVASALAGEPLRVFGDGSQTRCFCDARDAAAALPKLLGMDACRGRVFNLGSDRSISIGELAALVISTLSSQSQVELVPYDRAYPAGFEDLKQRQPDLSRVREAIGFEPKIPLERTIEDIAAFIANAQTASTTPDPTTTA